MTLRQERWDSALVDKEWSVCICRTGIVDHSKVWPLMTHEERTTCFLIDWRNRTKSAVPRRAKQGSIG